MNNIKVVFSLIILSQMLINAAPGDIISDPEMIEIQAQIERQNQADLAKKNNISNSAQQPSESNQCAFYAFGNALESIRSRRDHRSFDKQLSESLAHFIRDLALTVNIKYINNPNSLFYAADITQLLIKTGNSLIEEEFKNSNITLISNREMSAFNELCLWAPKPGAIIYFDEIRNHFICLDIDPSRRENEIIIRDSMELVTDKIHSSTEHYSQLINQIKEKFNIILPAIRNSPGRQRIELPIRRQSPTRLIPQEPDYSQMTRSRFRSPQQRTQSPIRQLYQESITRKRLNKEREEQEERESIALANRLAKEEKTLENRRKAQKEKERLELIECPACTFANPLTKYRCEICETILIK